MRFTELNIVLRATKLCDLLKQLNIDLKHDRALDIISRLEGYKDYAEMYEVLKEENKGWERRRRF
jgi:hypothetical protein